MKITRRSDGAAKNTDLKINISETRLIIIICPAVILAKSLIIRAKGLVNKPIISTGIMIGDSHLGTPGVLKICPQYALLPLNWVTIKVQVASTNVTAMFPVTLAPKGKKGISPIRLIIRMKKKAVRR